MPIHTNTLKYIPTKYLFLTADLDFDSEEVAVLVTVLTSTVEKVKGTYSHLNNLMLLTWVNRDNEIILATFNC